MQNASFPMLYFGGYFDHYSDYRRAFRTPRRWRLLRIPQAGIAED
jgi:hypothetical protein